MIVQPFRQPFEDYLSHSDIAIAPICTLHNVPGRVSGIGLSDYALDYPDIPIVLAPMLPVGVRRAPLRRRVGFELLQSLCLRVPAQVEPELEDQGSCV